MTVPYGPPVPMIEDLAAHPPARPPIAALSLDHCACGVVAHQRFFALDPAITCWRWRRG